MPRRPASSEARSSRSSGCQVEALRRTKMQICNIQYEVNEVGKTLRNHPFGNSLYKLFMVIWGMVITSNCRWQSMAVMLVSFPLFQVLPLSQFFPLSLFSVCHLFCWHFVCSARSVVFILHVVLVCFLLFFWFLFMFFSFSVHSSWSGSCLVCLILAVLVLSIVFLILRVFNEYIYNII